MKRDFCYISGESSATLSLAAVGEVENVPNELGDFAGDITSQSVQAVPGFFLLLIGDKIVI